MVLRDTDEKYTFISWDNQEIIYKYHLFEERNLQ